MLGFFLAHDLFQGKREKGRRRERREGERRERAGERETEREKT